MPPCLTGSCNKRSKCSICRHWDEVSDSVRDKYVAIVTATLSSLLRSLEKDAVAKPAAEEDADDSFDSDDGETEDSVTSRRNAFKQLVFLLCEVASGCAKLDSDAAAKSDKPARGKAKTGEASGNKAHVFLERTMTALVAAGDSEFNRLWPLGVPEEVSVVLSDSMGV